MGTDDDVDLTPPKGERQEFRDFRWMDLAELARDPDRRAAIGEAGRAVLLEVLLADPAPAELRSLGGLVAGWPTGAALEEARRLVADASVAPARRYALVLGLLARPEPLLGLSTRLRVDASLPAAPQAISLPPLHSLDAKR